MKTIAIIDDDIHIGDMLREVLVQEGYSVLRAYSGTEALYLLSQNKPDLVLLDLMLPGLSGEEVLPHIENIPVIVLSAASCPYHCSAPQGRTTWRNQISFRWRFGFGYGFPFSDSTGAACEADPNGVCHLKTADGKSQTGNFKECPA